MIERKGVLVRTPTKESCRHEAPHTRKMLQFESDSTPNSLSLFCFLELFSKFFVAVVLWGGGVVCVWFGSSFVQDRSRVLRNFSREDINIKETAFESFINFKAIINGGKRVFERCTDLVFTEKHMIDCTI